MTGIPTAALIACAVIVLALGALLSAGESALLRFTRAAADDLIEEEQRTVRYTQVFHWSSTATEEHETRQPSAIWR